MVAPAAVAPAVVPPPLAPEPVPPPPAAVPTGPPPKKRQPWWIWVLAILAVILLGAMGFLAAQLLGDGDADASPSPSAETFELPDWEGDPITEVRVDAESRGLILIEEDEFSEDIPEGSVVRTEPEAGTEVREGDEITVFVSSGEETVPVPSLIGQTRNEANITLTQAGLRLGNVEEEFSDRPVGTVIRSNPTAGTEVPLDEQVDLVLSRGPEPTPTPAPTPPPTPTPPPPTPEPTSS
jgi:serine/threonine-protein kinase